MSNATNSENPFVYFILKYRNDPVLFVEKVFGVQPDAFMIRRSPDGDTPATAVEDTFGIAVFKVLQSAFERVTG